MHITACQGCSRRYKIPEEVFARKIEGKVRNFRCKHCKTLIELDGVKPASTPPDVVHEARAPEQLPATAEIPPAVPPVARSVHDAPTMPPPMNGECAPGADASESHESLAVPSLAADASDSEEQQDEEIDAPTRIWRPDPDVLVRARKSPRTLPPARGTKASTIPPVARVPRPMRKTDPMPRDLLALLTDGSSAYAQAAPAPASSSAPDEALEEVEAAVLVPVPVPIEGVASETRPIVATDSVAPGAPANDTSELEQQATAQAPVRRKFTRFVPIAVGIVAAASALAVWLLNGI